MSRSGTISAPLPAPEVVDAESASEMERYGIVRVPIDYFHVGGFRYTSLKEAIAQAKRQRPDGGLH